MTTVNLPQSHINTNVYISMLHQFCAVEVTRTSVWSGQILSQLIMTIYQNEHVSSSITQESRLS